MNPDEISPFDPMAGAAAQAPEAGAPDQPPPFDPAAFERMVLGSSTTGGTMSGAGREALTGVLESVAETGAPLAGGLMGLKIGTAVGGPPGAAVGLGTGLLAGWLMGEQAKKTLPPVPEEGSPVRVGTKFLADSLLTAPIAFGLPQAGQTAGRVARFVSSIGESARKAPGAYMTAETIMGLGAGIGAGVAEGLNPGDPFAQAVGGLAGGLSFQLPATIAQNAIVNVSPQLAKALNPVSWVTDFQGQRQAVTEAVAQRQQNRAVNTLYDLLEQQGEDIPALIRSLEAPNLPGVPNMTASQKTGNRTLAGLEARLALGSDRYRPETLAQAQEAFTALRVLVQRLEESGDPAALQAAAQLRDDKFNQMLTNRLFAAEARAADRVSRIPATNVAARQAIGDEIRFELELALDNARMVEREFWNVGLAQLMRDNPAPTADKIFAAALKKKKMTRDAYDRTKELVERFPDIRVDAQKTLDEWKAQGLTDEQARIRVKRGQDYRKFFELEDLESDLRVGIGIVSPLDIKPSMAAANFLDAVKTKSDANFDLLPAPLRNIMQSMGVTKSNFLQYKNGMRSAEGIESGTVPYRYLPQIKPMNAIDLLSNRSELLDMARDARAAGELSNAGILEKVAAGLLTDLEQVNSSLLNEARAFSRSLNDTFTRTYANDILSVNPRGGEKLTPGQIVTGLRQDTQRMDEVRDAVSFSRRTYEDALNRFGPDDPITKGLQPLVSMADESLQTVSNAQRSILLGVAARTLKQINDPVTGTVRTEVNPAALTKFVNENRELLDRLGMTATLENATQAQNALELVRMQNSALNRDLRNQTAFAKVLAAGEDPVEAIVTAMKGRHSARDMGQLVKLAKADGQAAMDGMKSIVYEYLFKTAGGTDKFSPTEYQRLLFEPISRGQPSVVNIMRSQGLMSLTELKNLKRILDPMIRIEKGLEANVPIENFMTGASAIEDLALRVIGARIGTVASAGGPGSLIAASAGSKYMRQMFDQMPMLEMRRVIEKATQDPAFMADLLKRGRTQRESLDIAKKLRSYMITSGLTAAGPEPEEEPMFPTAPQSSAQRLFKQLPPAPTTRGVPGMGQQPPAPGPQSAAPGAGAPSQSRAMLQSLFPFDTLSAMAAQPPQAPPPG
jgi:hypothetical protein